MNNQEQQRKRRRRKAPEQPPYRRVQHTLPLGETSAIRALLISEGLWQLVTPEMREVYYHYVDVHHRRRDFCAIGWRNENGGWEVRATGFCGYIGRKGMTFIPGHADHLLVFPDMAGYICWRFGHPKERDSILILNHAEFAAAAGKRALRYSSVTVYQDQQPVRLVKSQPHGAAA